MSEKNGRGVVYTSYFKFTSEIIMAVNKRNDVQYYFYGIVSTNYRPELEIK